MVVRSAISFAQGATMTRVVFGLGLSVLLAGPVLAQDVSFGERIYQDKADCKFCHGAQGDGRGDPRSPGAAVNFHKTALNKAQMIEVISCGRPGSEMPHFDKYAYDDDTPCYGMKEADVGANMPPSPHSTSLTKREIEAVADYLLAQFVGK
jgi:mono/diheme cytochrome c family protein